jgi:hypothetical protein
VRILVGSAPNYRRIRLSTMRKNEFVGKYVMGAECGDITNTTVSLKSYHLHLPSQVLNICGYPYRKLNPGLKAVNLLFRRVTYSLVVMFFCTTI